MAVYSGLATRVQPTTEQSPRIVAGPNIIVLHHAAATDLNAVVALMMPGGRQVSAHLAVKNAQRVAVVDERMRAWSLSSPTYDSKALTVETCNSSTGGSWPLSASSHESLAQLCADWHRRYKIPLDSAHIMGHRDVYIRYGASYATACPGGMDIPWIIRRARQIAGDTSVVVPPISTGSGGGGDAYPSGTWNGYDIKTIQGRVNRMGYAPALEIDDVYGPKTRAGVVWAQKKLGVTADGDWGPVTNAAYLARYGGTTVPASTVGRITVDGVWGPQTTRALQDDLGVTVDGVFGPQTIRALQRRVGVYPDGVFGPVSKRALQRRLGVTADGIIGPVTVAALQRRLNAGRL